MVALVCTTAGDFIFLFLAGMRGSRPEIVCRIKKNARVKLSLKWKARVTFHVKLFFETNLVLPFIFNVV